MALRFGTTTSKHAKSSSKVVNDALADMQTHARRFADADHSSDQLIDFDEFKEMLPAKLKKQFSAEQVRAWFDAADRDGSGEISIGEYFLWTLHNTAELHGPDVLALIFGKYDPDNSGQIELDEFQSACDDLGFGLVAQQVFRMLDPDGSGTISLDELTSAVQMGMPTDAESKKLLTSMATTFDSESKAETAATLSRSKEWVVKGSSVAELTHHMRKLISESGAAVIDVVRKFDVDADRSLLIDQMEFYNALRNEFGYRGPVSLIFALFRALDEDGSGEIGFDELYEFIRGKRHSLDYRNKKVRDLTMAPPPDESEYTLSDIDWTEASLRLMFHKMLTRSKLGALDVIKAWDNDGNGEVQLKEFLQHLGALFQGHEKTWKEEVEPLSKFIFNRMACTTTRDRIQEVRLSGNELEVWLRKGGEKHSEDAPPLKDLGPKKRGTKKKKAEGAAAKAAERNALPEVARPKKGTYYVCEPSFAGFKVFAASPVKERPFGSTPSAPVTALLRLDALVSHPPDRPPEQMTRMPPTKMATRSLPSLQRLSTGASNGDVLMAASNALTPIAADHHWSPSPDLPPTGSTGTASRTKRRAAPSDSWRHGELKRREQLRSDIASWRAQQMQMGAEWIESHRAN